MTTTYSRIAAYNPPTPEMRELIEMGNTIASEQKKAKAEAEAKAKAKAERLRRINLANAPSSIRTAAPPSQPPPKVQLFLPMRTQIPSIQPTQAAPPMDQSLLSIQQTRGFDDNAILQSQIPQAAPMQQTRGLQERQDTLNSRARSLLDDAVIPQARVSQTNQDLLGTATPQTAYGQYEPTVPTYQGLSEQQIGQWETTQRQAQEQAIQRAMTESRARQEAQLGAGGLYGSSIMADVGSDLAEREAGLLQQSAADTATAAMDIRQAEFDRANRFGLDVYGEQSLTGRQAMSQDFTTSRDLALHGYNIARATNDNNLQQNLMQYEAELGSVADMRNQGFSLERIASDYEGKGGLSAQESMQRMREMSAELGYDVSRMKADTQNQLLLLAQSDKYATAMERLRQGHTIEQITLDFLGRAGLKQADIDLAIWQQQRGIEANREAQLLDWEGRGMLKKADVDLAQMQSTWDKEAQLLDFEGRGMLKKADTDLAQMLQRNKIKANRESQLLDWEGQGLLKKADVDLAIYQQQEAARVAREAAIQQHGFDTENMTQEQANLIDTITHQYTGDYILDQQRLIGGYLQDVNKADLALRNQESAQDFQAAEGAADRLTKAYLGEMQARGGAGSMTSDLALLNAKFDREAELANRQRGWDLSDFDRDVGTMTPGGYKEVPNWDAPALGEGNEGKTARQAYVDTFGLTGYWAKNPEKHYAEHASKFPDDPVYKERDAEGNIIRDAADVLPMSREYQEPAYQPGMNVRQQALLQQMLNDGDITEEDASVIDDILAVGARTGLAWATGGISEAAIYALKKLGF